MDIIEYGILSINKDLIRINQQKIYEDPHSTTRMGPLSQVGQHPTILTDRLLLSPNNPLSTKEDAIILGEETLISSMPQIAL
jgi:hypothetical protein